MSIKDPRINTMVVSGKMAELVDTLTFGEHTLTKIKVEVFNLCRNKDTKQFEYKPYTIEAKGWNKTAEKLKALAPGDRVVLTGKLLAEVFEYNGKPAQKLYLDVSNVGTFEAEDKPAPAPAPKAPPVPAVFEPIPEDDIPF